MKCIDMKLHDSVQKYFDFVNVEKKIWNFKIETALAKIFIRNMLPLKLRKDIDWSLDM